jgi:endonuclease/exonuclease/phosphatase family metal-dependent hydrolase
MYDSLPYMKRKSTTALPFEASVALYKIASVGTMLTERLHSTRSRDSRGPVHVDQEGRRCAQALVDQPQGQGRQVVCITVSEFVRIG